MTDIKGRLLKMSEAIYLVAENVVATDIAVTAREAAERIASLEAGLAIKPLEWVKHNIEGTLWSSQVTCCGEYFVRHDGEHWLALTGVVISKETSCDAAKAAAQAHYEARIRSALLNPGPGDTNVQ